MNSTHVTAKTSKYGNNTIPAASVMSHHTGTVVYGVDESYVKTSEGILKILQILLGFFAWTIMASLPYTQMIYTKGNTAPFHLVMALLIIGWIVTVVFFIIRFGGWLMDNKFWATTASQSKGVTIINIFGCVLFIIAGAILASNCENFNMGTSAYSSYGGVQGTYNRYGYESQDQNQNGNDEKVNFGGCDSFNVNQPYCSRYPEECRKYFDECMKIAQGTGYNKYYINAIVTCVFIFITALLYLIAAIIACKGTAQELLEGVGGDEDDEGNEIAFTHDDLNTSLRSHSWKRSQRQAKSSRRDEESIVNEKPRDSSTIKSGKHSRSEYRR